MTKLQKIFGIGLILGLSFGIFIFDRSHSQAARAEAELPRVYIDTTYPTPPAGSVIRNVKPKCATSESNCYTSLQKAINEAVMGDQIVIQAGMKIMGPIKLQHKTQGSGFTIIRTSDLSALPAAGKRVDPTNASAMPKILAPGRGEGALVTEDNADNYRIVGIEFTKANADDLVYTMVRLGDVDGQTSYSQVPKNIVLDRVYVHGDPTSYLKRCIELNSSFTAVIDSYVADCHAVGQDAQGIGGSNGPGPFKIVNNFIQASTENILFGGDVPRIKGLTPTDIEIRGNYITKDLTWKNSSKHWAVKNLVELKQGLRVLIDGNIIENSWLDGQLGYLVVLTPRNSGGSKSTGATWAKVQDITITNNVIRHGAGALQIMGYDYFDGKNAGSDQARDILVANNLFYDISKTWNDSKVPLIAITARPANIIFDHNTFINSSGNNLSIDSKRSGNKYDTVDGLVFTNNTMFHTSYGFFGGSTSEGNKTFAAYAPGIDFEKNVLASDSKIESKYPSSNNCNATCYPSEKDWQNQFVDYQAGLNGNINGFKIKSSSSYKNLGADIDKISAAIAGAFSPSAITIPTFNPTPLPTPKPTPSPAPNPSPVSSTGSGGRVSASSTSVSPVPPSPAVSLRSGSLVKGTDAAIYLMIGSNRYAFSSAEEFLNKGYRFNQVETVSDSSLSQYSITSNFSRPSGTLLKYPNSAAIYFLNSEKKKTAFPSAAVFLAWKNNFGNVITIPTSEFYPDGPTVTLPNGVLVKGSHSTVYMTDNNQLRPFASGQQFLNLGYSFSKIITVPDTDLGRQAIGPVI